MDCSASFLTTRLKLYLQSDKYNSVYKDIRFQLKHIYTTDTEKLLSSPIMSILIASMLKKYWVTAANIKLVFAQATKYS